MPRKTGLGSGLNALFADNALDDISSSGSAEVSVMRVAHIEPKKAQPRKDFKKESLAELADSIAKHGIIQPIIVRSLPNGYYQIIAGERRWRAAKMAGLDEVPVVIKNVNDLTAAEMTMVENLQREDLNPIEEARGYKYLADNYNLTQEEISRRVAKSRSVVTNAIRILSLPESILETIEQGELSAGHARALLSIDDPAAQISLAEKIILNGLSVRDAEKNAKLIKDKAAAIINADAENEEEDGENNPGETETDGAADMILQSSRKIEEMYLKNLQDKISGLLGSRVVINSGGKNGSQSGRLEIEYKSSDELEAIIKALCGGNDKDIFE
ncbi:MAG: ParB/RepB/Spo0J family partition protein [Oscillospiraceae bacterium]|nr:ParB/RepB/Spo0J family partition protein [Oscillospiraceae bacterium]